MVYVIFNPCFSHALAFQVVGLDLVDDESKPERRPTKHMPTPAQWTNIFNPAFSYYVYYCYANLYTLNKVSFYFTHLSFYFLLHHLLLEIDCYICLQISFRSLFLVWCKSLTIFFFFFWMVINENVTFSFYYDILLQA